MRRIMIAAAVLAVGMTGISAPSASALSSYDIKFGTQVVRTGGSLPVIVQNLYNSKSCTARLVGPGSSASKTLPVRRYEAKGRLKAPSAAGLYRIRVACGKDGVATSDPVMVVAASSPLKATCDVVESGFSNGTGGSLDRATFGAVVRNASPELAATGVELAVTFRDAAGNVTATDTVDVNAIPPGGAALVGDDYVNSSGGVTMSVLSKCDTSLDPVDPTITGGGTATLDSYGDATLKGQFVNSLPYTLDQYSSVDVILRNPSGAIVGGTSTSLDAFVPPGGVGTWSTYFFFMSLNYVPSVQAQLSPRKQD